MKTKKKKPKKLIKFFLQILGKPFYQGLEDHISEEAGGFVDGPAIPLGSPARSSPQSQGSEVTERFSRKVFVGGLPPDIDEGKFYLFYFIYINLCTVKMIIWFAHRWNYYTISKSL